MKTGRIAVLNFSGNVGKSTVARHLLAPRMDNCPVLFVETINEGGDATNVKGKDFKEILIEMALSDQAIVDIGSSNIEQVFSQLKSMVNAHEDFDFYVIPTVPSQKQQRDTTKIFTELLGLGIEAKKIKIVFNQVEMDSAIKKVFSSLLNTVSEYSIPLDAVIHLNDVYPLLGTMTMDEAIADGVDFKAQIAATDDLDEKRTLATLLALSRLAKGAKKELDQVFNAMFAGSLQ